MVTLVLALQVVIALGILNVWVIRRNWKTSYRGGNSKNIKEEFQHYGLPKWSVALVGAAKVTLALLLLLGLWYPPIAGFAAFGLSLFMLVAVLMHFKVKDPLLKAVPAFLMLVMCCVVFMNSQDFNNFIASN